jgi:putative oxidoreductase
MMAHQRYTASMRATATAARPMDETSHAFADDSSNNSILLVARCLVAGLFFWSGFGQVQGYDETTAFMIHHGVISTLLPVAVFIELSGAILLVVGYRMHFTALSLASFCVLTALLFHANFTDHAQMFHFLKNCAIAGGLLALNVAGPGRISLDGAAEVQSDDK